MPGPFITDQSTLKFREHYSRLLDLLNEEILRGDWDQVVYLARQIKETESDRLRQVRIGYLREAVDRSNWGEVERIAQALRDSS